MTADEWFVGKEKREDKSPFGQPLYLDIDTLDLTVRYRTTDRTSFSLTIPVSSGSHSRYYSDGQRHEVSAAGLGDISLVAYRWMISPASQGKGNVQAGLGVKVPTGRYDVTDNWYVPEGSFKYTVDQSIQLGDGGWGILVEGLAYRQLSQDWVGFADGSYLISPRNETDVFQAPAGPFSTVRVSVPDVYRVEAGVSWTPGSRKVTMSLAGRVEGIPMHDLIGGSDGFRRPAIVGYLVPGLGYTWGRDTVTISVGVRTWVDFRPSRVDEELGTSGGGDLAAAPIFIGYQRRF